MRKYPDIPMYNEKKLKMLRKKTREIINPRNSVIVPKQLTKRYPKLSGGARQLLGAFHSAEAKGECIHDRTLLYPNHRIESLFKRCKKTAQRYKKELENEGLITVKPAKGAAGRGRHNLITLNTYMDYSSPDAVIPGSLYLRDEFRELPDDAKYLFGIIYADFITGKAYCDVNGNCYIPFRDKEVKGMIAMSPDTVDGYLRKLHRCGLIAKYQASCKSKQSLVVYVRDLGAD